MPGRNKRNLDRRRLAAEAARIIAEQGVVDYGRARQKAQTRLGLAGPKSLPEYWEIEQALEEYQRLFQGDRHSERIAQLRWAAKRAMQELSAFSPRLVGPVLNGTAGDGNSVRLHLFVDTPEEVALHLMDRNIPYRAGDRAMRFGREHRNMPVFRFEAGGTSLELVVLPRDGLRNPPLSPVDGKPERGATIEQVERLLGG
jgi:hypothetical protein